MKNQELLQQLRGNFKNSQIFSKLINAIKPILTWDDENQNIDFFNLDEDTKKTLQAKWQESETLINAEINNFSNLVGEAVGKEDFAADDLLPCYEKELASLKIEYQALRQLNIQIAELYNTLQEINQKLGYIDANISKLFYYFNSLSTIVNFAIEPTLVEKLLEDIQSSDQLMLNSCLEEIKESLSMDDSSAVIFLTEKVLTKLSIPALIAFIKKENDQALLEQIAKEAAYKLSSKSEQDLGYIKLLVNLEDKVSIGPIVKQEIEDYRVQGILEQLNNFFNSETYSELNSDKQEKYIQFQNMLIKFEIGKMHANDLRRAGFNSAAIEQQADAELALDKLNEHIEDNNTISEKLGLDELSEMYVKISEFVKSSKYNILSSENQTRLTYLQNMASNRLLELVKMQKANFTIENLLQAIEVLHNNGFGFSRILGNSPTIETIETLLGEIAKKRDSQFEGHLYNWLKAHTPSHKLAEERAALNKKVKAAENGEIDQESYSQYRKEVDEIASHQKGTTLHSSFRSSLSLQAKDLYTVQPLYIKQFTAYDVHDYLHFASVSPKIKLKDSSKEIVNRVVRKQLYLREAEVNILVTRNLEEDNLVVTKDIVKLAKAKKFNLSNKNVLNIAKYSIGNDKQIAASILNRSLWSRITGSTALNDRLGGAELHEILLEIQNNLNANSNDEDLSKLAKTVLTKSSYRNKLSEFYSTKGVAALEKLDNIYIKGLLKARQGFIFDTKDALSSLYNEQIDAPRLHSSHNASTVTIENVKDVIVTPEQTQKIELAKYISNQVEIEIMPIADKNIHSLSDNERDALKELVEHLLNGSTAEKEKLAALVQSFAIINKVAIQVIAAKQLEQDCQQQAVAAEQKTEAVSTDLEQPDRRRDVGVGAH